MLVPDIPVEGSELINGLRDAKAMRVVITAARALIAKDIRLSDAGNSPHYLPKIILQYKLAEGCSKSQLGDAMRKLIMDGKLEKKPIGEYPNRTPIIGLCIAA